MNKPTLGRRACCAVLLTTFLFGSGASWGQAATGPGDADPHPKAWRTWVSTSGSQFRLAPPPDATATRGELDELRALRVSRDEEALGRIAWWHAAAPSYRWNQIAIEEALQAGLPVNVASRHLALLHTALADAMVAAWDSKAAHNRQRPNTMDPALRPAIATPESPSYPDEYAVAGAVASTMLAEFFPRRAGDFARLAEESGRSRMLAGVAFPSDVTAGTALGLKVAAVVLDHGRRDGTDQRWTGTVPTSPSGWTGTNPALPQAPNWRPWLLASAAEFRLPAPPANDLPERAHDMAQLRAFERTPLSNARALYWEAAGGGLRSHEYWNGHAGRLLLESGRGADAPGAAHAYALLNVAMYDSGIACWDAKYAYWTMRPVQFDREFRALFAGPNHPSFPSAHSCISTTAASVLAHLFPGDAQALTALAREAGQSRIWAGIHYPSDVSGGEMLGRRVAERAIERARSDGAQNSAP